MGGATSSSGKTRARAGYDVYGQRLTASGALTGANFAISTAPSSQRAPRVAFCGNRFNTIFTDQRHGTSTLYRQLVSQSGSPLQTKPNQNEIVYAAATSVVDTSLTCAGNKLLLAMRHRVSPTNPQYTLRTIELSP